MSSPYSNPSELKPPQNITPSKGTISSVLAVGIPIALLFLGLFTGVLNP
ncbi:hypothetical protein [Altericista sp. CCNU0014]